MCRHRSARTYRSWLKRSRAWTGRVEFIGYVVARLLKKNGVPADQLPHLSKERRDQLQTSRITMMPQMPNTVELAEGHWWKPGDATPQAAISEDERRFYDFKLGDRLQYQIAGPHDGVSDNGHVQENGAVDRPAGRSGAARCHEGAAGRLCWVRCG